jgi:hypothetical protein
MHRDDNEGRATVTTADRDSWSGVIRNEDNFSIQLQSADGAFHLFRKAAIRSIERQPMTPRLTAGEMEDIISLLMSATADLNRVSVQER